MDPIGARPTLTSPRATGPRTPEGRARSAANARTHGLLSRAVVLPDESREKFEAFQRALADDLVPMGTTESLLADRIIACAWRLRRVLVLEAGVFEREQPSDTDRLIAETLGRAQPASHRGTLGLAFIRAGNSPADPFAKLSRYETTLERSLYRALHELQRLQAVRAGAHVPVPAVLDVEVSGDATA